MGGFWAWKCTVGQLERTCTQTGHDMDSSTDPDLYDFLAWRDMTQTVKRSSWEVWIVSLRPGVCHIEPARHNRLGNCFKGFRRVLIASLSSYWMLLLPPHTRPTLSQFQEIGGEFHLVQERLATDLKAPKLWKCRSGDCRSCMVFKFRHSNRHDPNSTFFVFLYF